MINVLSLCDGMSCGQIALKELNIPVENYYAAEIDKNAIKVTQDNFPDTIQLGDVMNLISEVDDNVVTVNESKLKEFPKIDLVIFGSPCFETGTKIITDSGYKNIEDIVVGDKVLTHTKVFQKVLKVGGKIASTVTLHCQGMIPTRVTLNHPYYVRHMTRVYDSSNRTYKRVLSEPDWVEVKNLKHDDYIGIPIIQTEENPYRLTKEDCWLIGRYVADGYINNSKRHGRKNSYNHQTVFCIGKHKIEDFKKHLVTKHGSISENKTVYKVRIINEPFMKLCMMCGKGAINKKIPQWILNLPVELATEFLNGYISGDGSYDKNRKTYNISTISTELALGLTLLIAKCKKVNTNISYFKPKPTTVIEGRTVNQRPAYRLRFSNEMKKQSNAIVDENFIWCRFNSYDNLSENRMVYNLEVENDNSYTANNIVVHNCRSLSKATAGREEYNNGLEGVSWLFYPCNAILQWIKQYNNPDVKFMVENVDTDKIDDLNTISECLGVQPVLINSGLFSAQTRLRYYWTNIKTGQLPFRNNLVLKDIMDKNVDDKYFYNDTKFDFYSLNKRVCAILHINGNDILKRVYSPKFKAPTLTSCRGGNLQKKVYDNGRCRKLTPNEYRKLQTIPEWYKMNVADSHIYNMCGDGWTIEVIKYIFNDLKG